MDSIVARYSLQFRDLEQGRKLFYRGALKFLKLLILVVSTIYLARRFEITKSWQDTFLTTVVIFAFAVAGLFVLPWIFKLLRKKAFAQSMDADQEIEWSITDEEIKISTPTSQSEIKWSAISKVSSYPEGFLFFCGPIYKFIPRHAFLTENDFSSLKLVASRLAKEYEATD